MDNNTNPQPPPIPKPEKKSNVQTVVVLFLLVASMAGNIFLWFKWDIEKGKVEIIFSENASLEGEKMTLDAELEDLMVEYENLDTENEEIQGQIAEQKAKIEEMIAEAKKHKDDAWIIYKLRKEAKTLRKIMKGYVYTIDSINTLNVQLREEKAVMTVELGQQKEKVTQLENVKQGLEATVKKGSKLEALNLSGMAQKVKNNNVHRETTRAEKAEKIRTCFTLSRNEIAKSGAKQIYVRIVRPDGEVLSLTKDEGDMFEYNGVKGQYSMKKEVIYDNEELEICMYWEVSDAIPAGKYSITVYADEMDIGTTNFSLK